MKNLSLAFLIMPMVIFSTYSCTNSDSKPQTIASPKPEFYYGGDLSYVNEMEDCGAVYKDSLNRETDPYKLWADYGGNLIRLRLWHSPDWTTYSTLNDVIRSAKKARENGLQVLLDFHYSDDWADPQKQVAPKAWHGVLNNTPALADSVYNYTYNTLDRLHKLDLLPAMVQVGNEINHMILQEEAGSFTRDWQRNSTLINSGIKAVRDYSVDFGTPIEIMLHVAQPENALTWFREAKNNGVTDFDWIGISYYPKWSTYELENLEKALSILIREHQKELMVVETAYPFTMENIDDANNLMDQSALTANYPATPEGQLGYLNHLKTIIKDAGGKGLVYWEPAWVSTPCQTRWGTGSHWDNATLYNHELRPNPGMKFMSSEH